MKWFKHHCGLCRDEGVRKYLDKAGKDRLNAYGFLMLVLEAICERMANPNTGNYGCSVQYSDKEWARVLGCHVNRVNKYMGLLPHISWVSVEFEEHNYRVRAAKLLEWRDEYSRKSGVGPDKVAQRRTDKIRRDEREINNDALSNKRLNNGSSHTPPSGFKVTDELRQWAMLNYPEVSIDEETAKYRNWEQPSPRNDWDAAWKLWIQRGSERQRNSEPAPDKARSIQALRKLGKELNIEPKPGESDDDYLGRVKRANDKRIDDLNS